MSDAEYRQVLLGDNLREDEEDGNLRHCHAKLSVTLKHSGTDSVPFRVSVPRP